MRGNKLESSVRTVSPESLLIHNSQFTIRLGRLIHKSQVTIGFHHLSLSYCPSRIPGRIFTSADPRPTTLFFCFSRNSTR
jgi:TATA-box binding protein (TBP) (component of TFIID and TFIIIB)